MSETTLPFMLELITISPDPQNKTMRSNLEPSKKIIVQVNLPQKAEFIENIQPIIEFQLGTDSKLTEQPEPILTPAGLTELYRMLSHPFTPEQEEVDNEEWTDADDAKEDTSDDEGWDETESNDDNSDDDDEGWED